MDMQEQDQGQGGGFDIQNVIQSLVEMLSPAEAGAATRRPSAPVANQIPQQAAPVTSLPPVPGMAQQPDYSGMQTQQALQLRQQMMAQQAQQQKMQLEHQKLQAKTQPQDVGARLAQILGESGGAGGEPADVLFRGVTPGTGTKYFSNFKAPEGYAPEPQRQQFMQDYQARQDAIASQKAQAASGGGNVERLTKVTQLMTTLEKAGVPADVRTLILAKTFPDYKADKELTPDQMGKLWKFNPNTRDFEPVPPELTGKPSKELQAMGYRSYSDKARTSVDEMKDVDVAFQQLKSAVSGIKTKSVPELWMSKTSSGQLGGDEGAVFQKASTNFTTIFDKFLGGVRGGGSPAMQAIREKVLPNIASTNTLSTKLMDDLGQLVQQMGDTRLKAVVGGKALEQRDLAGLNSQATKVLQTWAQTQGGRAAQQQGRPAGEGGGRNVPQGGKDTGRTAKGKTVYALPNGKLWAED